MGAKLRVENQTANDLLIQIELTGMTKNVPPSSQLVIDTDFDSCEELHMQILSDRLVVWGGVAARIVEEHQHIS